MLSLVATRAKTGSLTSLPSFGVAKVPGSSPECTFVLFHLLGEDVISCVCTLAVKVEQLETSMFSLVSRALVPAALVTCPYEVSSILQLLLH